MKKLFLIIGVWILVCSTALCQSSMYFNKILSSIPGASTISTVLEEDSGYLLVIDNKLPFPNKQNTLFVRVSKQGEIIDSIQYSGDFRMSAVFPGNTAVRTNSGDFVVCTNRTDTNYHDYGYLMCLDQNLDTLWTRTFTHPDTHCVDLPGARVFNIITAIRQTWDGGFIIAGNYSKNCIQGNTRSYLLKTDSMGVMEWIRTYNAQSNVFSLAITSDSGYAFTDFSGGFHINITDQNGEVLIRRKPNNELHLVSGSVGVLSNGDLVIMAPYVYDVPIPSVYLRGINTIRYTPDGIKVWDEKHYLYHGVRCLTTHQAFTLQVLGDDHIVIAATTQVKGVGGNVAYKGAMLKLTPDGDSLWARYHGYSSFGLDCQFEHMISTADGGFLAVGFYYPNAPSKPWLVKMDSLGCDTPGCHLISTEDLPARQHGDMTLYPNPFSHELNIALPESPAGATATLYDIQGRIMQQTRIPEYLHTNHYTLQTNDLSPGIYILHLVTRDGVTHVGRVVRGR